MPLFEVDANRPLLVQSGRPTADRDPGVGTSAHQVVESHIDGLLGEQIFPVAPGSGPDEPHLLALDATGSPVVVELVGELDRAALTRALDHAGSAGRMTRGELAARYHGGAAAFQRDVATFYDSVPVTRSQPGRSGARLIIICQDASEEILNAVDFLRQPSMPVEVLKLGVVHSADGRRFVDVSPLVIHPASEPGAPRLSSADPARPAGPGAPVEQRFRRSVPRPADVEPEAFAEKVAVGLALTGKMPAVVQAPRTDADDDEGPTAASTTTPRTRATRAERRAAGMGLPLPGVPATVQDTEPAPAPAAPAPAPEPQRVSAAPRRSRTDRFSPQAEHVPERALETDVDGPRLGEVFASVMTPSLDLPSAPFAPSPPSPPSHSPWEPAEPQESRWEPSGREPRASASGWDTPAWDDASADTPLRVPPLEAPTYTPPSYERPSYDPLDRDPLDRDPLDRDPLDRDPLDRDPLDRDPLDRDPLSYGRQADDEPSYGSSYQPPTYPSVPTDGEVDQDLVALAARLGRPTALVWSRPRRRQHFMATLHPDGTIELADGGRYRSPDAAASMAAGSPTADGWGVWRLGDAGPTLLDAYREHFA